LETLTGRELDVLKLVARGLTNPELGQELYIAETTVRTHLGHILTKVGL
jgi:DNA-binding NarL/FixJ family response regulator